jgi:hypothetical protein
MTCRAEVNYHRLQAGGFEQYCRLEADFANVLVMGSIPNTKG